MQDTHFNEKDEMLIQTQWGSKASFNSFGTNSRGVAILLDENFEYKQHNVDKDDSGTYLILDTTIENIICFTGKYIWPKFRCINI